MTNYREILRLDSLGFNKTQIAEACGCSRKTVIQTLRPAKENRLQYPLSDSMSDKQLADLLFPDAAGKPTFKMPDYEYVHREGTVNKSSQIRDSELLIKQHSEAVFPWIEG